MILIPFIGSFKRHTKSVHFCEFSPTGKFLFTGSIDGTAKVWSLDSDKKNAIGLNDDRLLITLAHNKDKKRNLQNGQDVF